MSTLEGASQAASSMVGSKEKYDLRVYLTFLKQQSLSPVALDTPLTVNILLTTFPRFQTGDFSACIALFPEKVLDMPLFASLCEMESLLQECKFSTFWARYRAFVAENQSMLVDPVGSAWMEELMRAAIIEVFSITFQRTSTKEFLAALGISSPAVLEKLAGPLKGLFSVNGTEVIFTENQFNTPHPTKQQTRLSPSEVAKIVAV